MQNTYISGAMSFFDPDTIYPTGRLETADRPPMRVDVVKATDSNRGFRLFDNTVFVVRDVASEELFLERIRMAHAVFQTVVAPHMDSSVFELAKKLVLATKICLSRYFNAQSLARTDRPFVVKAEYRDSPTLFCARSDFLRAYLYTRTTGDHLFDDQPYDQTGERDFDTVMRGINSDRDPGTPLTDREMAMEYCRVRWQMGALQARYMMEGGPASDVGHMNPDAVGAVDAPLQSQRSEAILYIVADTTALAEFLSYMFYMTPVDLKRRYEVKTGCMTSSVTGADSKLTRQARTCCQEQSSRHNSTDAVRRAIQEFLQKRDATNDVRRRDETLETSSFAGQNPEFAEFLQREQHGERASRLRRRNDTLVENLLLLLFDKSLSTILDNGFDNANKKRRYGTNAKSIGGATVYTGILDTVGKVVLRYREGVSLTRNTTRKVDISKRKTTT